MCWIKSERSIYLNRIIASFLIHVFIVMFHRSYMLVYPSILLWSARNLFDSSPSILTASIRTDESRVTASRLRELFH